MTMIVAGMMRSGMGRRHLGKSLRRHIPGDRATRTANLKPHLPSVCENFIQVFKMQLLRVGVFHQTLHKKHLIIHTHYQTHSHIFLVTMPLAFCWFFCTNAASVSIHHSSDPRHKIVRLRKLILWHMPCECTSCAFQKLKMWGKHIKLVSDTVQCPLGTRVWSIQNGQGSGQWTTSKDGPDVEWESLHCDEKPKMGSF